MKLDVQGLGGGRILDLDILGVWSLENWKIFMDVICVSSICVSSLRTKTFFTQTMSDTRPPFWLLNKGNQKNEIWSVNRIYEKFLLKNHTQNVVQSLLPDPFLKNQNWINNLNFFQLVYIVCPSWEIQKYTETKILTTCFTT